jgi:hypothetical protein
MASVLSDKVHAHDPAPNPDPRRLLRGRSARQARQPGQIELEATGNAPRDHDFPEENAVIRVAMEMSLT